MLSEGVDDAWVFEGFKIYQRDEDQRARIRLFDLIILLAVDMEGKRFATVGTFALDAYRERFICQLPLHEGCRCRVDPSSGVDLLAAFESDLVWRLVGRHRVGPGNRAGSVAVKESHAPFQFFQDQLHRGDRHIQASRDLFRGKRTAGLGQLAHNEVAYLVIVGGHEAEILGRFGSVLGDQPLPQEFGDGDQYPPDT